MRFLTRVLSTAAVLATALTVPLVAASPAHATDPDPFQPVKVSFSDSPHYVWTAPAGVYRVAVHLVGASGGSGAPTSSNQGGRGGYGGTVDAILDVHPGEVLTADLGGRGEDAVASSALAALGGRQALGYSGGAGGLGLDATGEPISSGGGGGAASTLSIGSLIWATAGGGGGGGGAGAGTGGGAGGAAGQPGSGVGAGTLADIGQTSGGAGSSATSSFNSGGGGGGGAGFPVGNGGNAVEFGYGAGGASGGASFSSLSGATVATDTVAEDGWVSFTPRPGLDAVPFFLTAGAISTAVHHSPLIISAAVISVTAGAPTPTGIVSFYDTASGFLGNADITGGRADLHVSTLPVGTHTIVAHYGGDSTYLPADVPGTQSVTVTPAPAMLATSTSAIDFGTLEESTTSASRTFFISNTGDDPLTLSTFFIPSAFTVDASDCLDGPLGAGQQCSVTLTIQPRHVAPTSYAVDLVVSSNAGGVTIPVTADVVHRAITLSPTAVSFGSLVVGTTATHTVTVTNTGTAAWIYSGTTTSTGEVAITGGTCVTGAGAAVGKSCTLAVAFTPAAVGSRTANVTVYGNPSAPLQLSATGVAIRRTATVSPSSVTWSAIVGTTATKTITLRNTGNVPWAITSRTLTAGAPLTITGGTCTAGKRLIPDATCTVVVSYHPTVAGTKGATLKIVDPAGTQQVAFKVTGIAVVKHLTATPSSVSFGTRARGTTTTLTITIRNTGNVSFAPGRPTVSAPFAIAATTCTSVVAPGKACSVRVTFRPTAVGSRSAALVVPGSAPALRIRVAGTGR